MPLSTPGEALLTLYQEESPLLEGKNGLFLTVGAVLIFGLGFISSAAYEAWTEELMDDGLPLLGPPSPWKAPVLAWRRKMEAEAALQSNAFTRLTGPELSFRAGQAQLLPYYMGFSLLSLASVKLVGVGTLNALLVNFRTLSGGTALAS